MICTTINTLRAYLRRVAGVVNSKKRFPDISAERVRTLSWNATGRSAVTHRPAAGKIAHCGAYLYLSDEAQLHRRGSSCDTRGRMLGAGDHNDATKVGLVQIQLQFVNLEIAVP